MKYIAILMLCVLLFSGCNSAGKLNSESQTTPGESIVVTVCSLSASIYYGNDNADGFECISVPVEELNTATLIQELISAGVLSDQTKVLNEELIGTCLHLDLNEAFRTQLCSTGTSGEYIIIGSLVNTFLDNYMDTVHSIYITVNGDMLESGHVIYDFELTRYE